MGCSDAGSGGGELITEACLLDGTIPSGRCFRAAHACDGPEDCVSGQFCYVVAPSFSESTRDLRYCTEVERPAGPGDAYAARICHADCDCPSEHPRCTSRFSFRICE